MRGFVARACTMPLKMPIACVLCVCGLGWMRKVQSCGNKGQAVGGGGKRGEVASLGATVAIPRELWV